MISEYPRPGEVPTGGVQVSVHRLIQALENVGVEITILAPDTGAVREYWVSDGGHGIVRVPAEKRWSLLRGLRAWRQNARVILQDLRPDIVHAQGVVAAGLVAADTVGVARISTTHGNAGADTRAAYGGVSGLAELPSVTGSRASGRARGRSRRQPSGLACEPTDPTSQVLPYPQHRR